MTFAQQQDHTRTSRANSLKREGIDLDESQNAYGINASALPRESDFVKYDDQVMGSTEQRRFKVNQISGGPISSPGNPRRSCDTFYSTYLN